MAIRKKKGKRYPLVVITEAVWGFFRDGGTMHAAALSYFSIVAIVPVLLLMAAVFGHILGDNREFMKFVTDKLAFMFPSITSGIAKELTKIVAFRQLALPGLILYTLLAYQLYGALHKALEAIFKVPEKRHILGMIYMPLIVVTTIMTLLFTSFAMTTSTPLFDYLEQQFPNVHALGAMSSFMVSYVIPLMIVFLAAAFIYMAIPNKRIVFNDAFWGGLFTAIAVEGAKHGFTWYMTTIITRFGKVYGSLTAFITFLIWVYVSSCIFLIGGEIVNILHDRRTYRRRLQPSE